MNAEIDSTFGMMRNISKDYDWKEVVSKFFEFNLELYTYDLFYYQVRYVVDETVVRK